VTSRLARNLRFALAVALLGSVAGCDTLSSINPFKEDEKPLPGERRPVAPVAPPPPDSVPQPLSGLPDLRGSADLA
jgi:hypothetical protein